MRRENEGHFLVGTVILGFLIIFKKGQASSTFEALNSECLSRCQRDLKPIVEIMKRPRAFCRFSTGDSDFLSFCDMNEEPGLTLCREIRPSYESGHLGVHFSWSRKHSILLTYTFLRENSLEVLVESWLTSSVEDR